MEQGFWSGFVDAATRGRPSQSTREPTGKPAPMRQGALVLIALLPLGGLFWSVATSFDDRKAIGEFATVRRDLQGQIEVRTLEVARQSRVVGDLSEEKKQLTAKVEARDLDLAGKSRQVGELAEEKKQLTAKVEAIQQDVVAKERALDAAEHAKRDLTAQVERINRDLATAMSAHTDHEVVARLALFEGKLAEHGRDVRQLGELLSARPKAGETRESRARAIKDVMSKMEIWDEGNWTGVLELLKDGKPHFPR